MKKKTVILEIYDKIIDFYLGTEKEIYEILDKYACPRECKRTFRGFCRPQKGFKGIDIFINVSIPGQDDKRTFIEVSTILVHEIRHAVDKITEHLGIDDTESAAYMTGYIYSKLFPVVLEEYEILAK